LNLSGQILVFGGCYSNLQATQALFAEAARRGIPAGNIINTGDIVAYGADAAATLRLVRDAGILSIMGNCEESLSTAAADCGCGFAPGSACDALAARWYAHADAQMAPEDRNFMAGLPRSIAFNLGGKNFRVLHGNAERGNSFLFGSAGNLEFARQLEIAGADVVLAGHCGLPFTRRVGAKIWHNAGSIGMPANDGTPRGWFSVIEVVGGEVRITSHPLAYDYAKAARAMRAAGLPEGYAAALETGIWPSLDILPAVEKARTGIPLEVERVAEPVPVVPLARLETLWINTGTLCNITCVDCFMESSPVNDALGYFPLAAFLALLETAPEEIGFTGGEPFMNPDILAMLEAALAAGRRVLVLTNAMRPMLRHQAALARLLADFSGRLRLRVSLDHYLPARHDELRGQGSFAASLKGVRFLAEAGPGLTVAARTPWGETEAMMRAGFGALFAEEGVALDPAALVLFPEMDVSSPAPPVTAAALAAVPAEKPVMCASSRMVVWRKGAEAASFTPCTLLPGRDLVDARAPVTLDHPFCGQFCVYGGASCAGAPG
jgi:predicted phosphodiesterase